MDAERLREFLLKLPHVEETMQWGDNLVYWVGDKAIGGKMFALVNLELTRKAYMMFHAGAERYAELLEIEGVIPAPYMARIHWIALERPDTLSDAELKALLSRAHSLVYAKMPQRTRDVLAMPPGARRKLTAERRKLLAARALEAKQAKAKLAQESVSKKKSAKKSGTKKSGETTPNKD